MKPDKIYLPWEYAEIDVLPPGVTTKQVFGKDVCYIRKDYLLEWLDKELDRLYELLPNASNENPSQMELRHLGQYMQTEKLIDKLESI